MRRDHWQIGKRPFAAFDVVFLGRRDFDQMADRRGQHVVVRLEILIVLGKAAQALRNVVCDRGLLSNDERFGHDVSESGGQQNAGWKAWTRFILYI